MNFIKIKERQNNEITFPPIDWQKSKFSNGNKQGLPRMWENPTESSKKKLLELIREFSKIATYMNNILINEKR